MFFSAWGKKGTFSTAATLWCNMYERTGKDSDTILWIFSFGFSFLFFNRDDLSRNYMTSYLKINNSSNIDRTWQSHWHIYRISPCLWYVEYMLSSTDSQKFYLEGILKIANKSLIFISEKENQEIVTKPYFVLYYIMIGKEKRKNIQYGCLNCTVQIILGN